MTDLEKCLMPTAMIDSEEEAIRQKAFSLIEGQSEITEKAIRLFYYVRDKVRYNPYVPLFPLRASATLGRRHGFCIQKAILLTALARAAGIPARLGFANIRNHLTPEKLMAIQKSDIFTHHGFSELYIDGDWIKATPAFDRGMCRENRILPVEFDGINHAMLHSHNLDGDLHIEYIHQHGSYADVPVDDIVNETINIYGKWYLDLWIAGLGSVIER